jgi:hypothetical protein
MAQCLLPLIKVHALPGGRLVRHYREGLPPVDESWWLEVLVDPRAQLPRTRDVPLGSPYPRLVLVHKIVWHFSKRLPAFVSLPRLYCDAIMRLRTRNQVGFAFREEVVVPTTQKAIRCGRASLRDPKPMRKGPRKLLDSALAAYMLALCSLSGPLLVAQIATGR